MPPSWESARVSSAMLPSNLDDARQGILDRSGGWAPFLLLHHGGSNGTSLARIWIDPAEAIAV
jgi:hypothetical protein